MIKDLSATAEQKRRYTFRQSNRLQKSRDFELAAAEGQKIYNQYLVVNYRKRGDNKSTRLGIITTRRLGKATRRNRLRRLVREAFRMQLPHLEHGYDIVVIVRERAREATLETIAKSVGSLLDKASLFINETPQSDR